MRLLVVGAGGQVGAKVVAAASKENEVHGTYMTRRPPTGVAGSWLLDKTEAAQVAEVFSGVNPEVVVDTAALHNVDYCESHPEEALAVNRDGTAHLADACRERGAKYIFVSTDYVFDGVGAPYSEEATPRPLNAYGVSKLEGEKAALEHNPDTVVVRPSVIYSWVPPENATGSSSGRPLNFGAWLAHQLAAKKELNIVTDQISSPTLADDLAGAILALVRSESRGVFHAAGATPVSRYEFSSIMARHLGLNENLIHPISTPQLEQAAKRPVDSSLISDRIWGEVGYKMMELDKALDVFTSQSREGSR